MGQEKRYARKRALAEHVAATPQHIRLSAFRPVSGLVCCSWNSCVAFPELDSSGVITQLDTLTVAGAAQALQTPKVLRTCFPFNPVLKSDGHR